MLSLAVSPDGKLLATGGVDRTIHLWEVLTGRELARWEAHDSGVTALAFRPDGKTLVSGGGARAQAVGPLPYSQRVGRVRAWT